jgi:hypothetical protein
MADFDLSNIQGLLGQFAPSEQERQAAKMQALVQFGLGLMGARRGQEFSQLGQSGLNAIGGYNQALSDIPRQKMASMAAAGQAVSLQDMLRKAQEDAQARQVTQDFYKNQPAAGPAMPGAPDAGPTKQSKFQLYTALGDRLSAQGLIAPAQKMYDIAEKLRPALESQKTLTTPDGKRVVVNVYKDGSTQVLPDLGPDKERAEKVDMGDRVAFVDPYTGNIPQGNAIFNKNVTPGEALSSETARRGQNMTDARAREFNANAAANGGQIVETADGFARIGKDNTVTPIVAGGEQLRAKPTGTIAQQIATNNVTLSKIDRALNLIDKVPGSFGLKNVLGDPIMQRLDPGGVDARSIVADIAGQKIHDRSGGAVSVGEAERLKPYVPNVTDDAATVKKKLLNFKREYTAMQSELQGGKSIAEVADRRAKSGPSIDDLVKKYAK